MTSPKQAFRSPLGNRPSSAAILSIVNEHSDERGIPPGSVATPAAEQPAPPQPNQKAAPSKKGKGASTAEQAQSPTKRLSVDIPDYLRAELRKKAADSENTIKYIICRALKKDGFHVEVRDLIEDGRREH